MHNLNVDFCSLSDSPNLSGGRTGSQDPVDHAVGIAHIAGRDRNGSDPLCKIHARTDESCDKAKFRVLSAIRKGGDVPEPVIERVDYSWGD